MGAHHTVFRRRFSARSSRAVRCLSVLLLSVLLVLSLTSCWSQREIDELAIVLGTALDAGESPDQLRLTAQVVKVNAIGTDPAQQGNSSNTKPYINISNTDTSMLSAVRGMSRMQSRKLYFAHNEVLILGNDLIRQDMTRVLDAFARDTETRINVNLLVAEGDASDVLDGGTSLEKTPARHIVGMFENQKFNSEVANITLRDFFIASLSETTCPIVPIIKIYEEGGESRLKLEDTAVFRGGKMIGRLDKRQTRGYLLIVGESEGSVMTVNTPWGQVIIETFCAGSKIRPVKNDDGSIGMQLTLQQEGSVQSNETDEDLTTPENMALLKQLMTESICADVQDAFLQAQSLTADIFGFGEAIQRRYPDEWREIKQDWSNFFSTLKLDVEIDAKLHSTGGMIKPVVPGGIE